MRLKVTIRAAEHRTLTDDDRRWCRQVVEALAKLIDVGGQVLSGGADPRQWRTVRKQTPRLF